MDQNHMDNDRLESLLKLAASRLGTSPEALKQAAQNGTLSDMLGNVNAGDSAAMQRVLSDPEAAKKLLATPQAQKLLQLLRGGGQGE